MDLLTGKKLAGVKDFDDYYESRFTAEKTDVDYPPVAKVIMWGHSQITRMMENVIAIRILNLPWVHTEKTKTNYVHATLSNANRHFSYKKK